MKVYDELIRVSQMNGRHEQDESTRTIDDQARANRAAAQQLGGRIGKTMKELDESGFTILPKVQAQVIERVRSGQTAGVIIAYSDRLARNWWDAGAFFTAMAEVGAEVIDATMPTIDYRSDEGRTVWGMKMVTNELPSLAAKRRGNSLADQLVRDGIPNQVPYGYRRNAELGVKTDPDKAEKALVPDDVLDEAGHVVGGTASTVRRIFALRVDGHGWYAICRILNEAGLPSARGGLWTTGSVNSIIRNEVYTGVVKLGQRRQEGAHTALVSVRDWRQAQAARTVNRNGNLVAGLAGGLLECSSCHRPLSVLGSPGGRKHYGCRRFSASSTCERPVYVKKDAADDFVERQIVELLDQGSGVDLVASARGLEQARHAMEDATEQRRRFARQSDILDEEDFREGYAIRKAAEAEAVAKYEELLAKAADVDDLPTSGSAWAALKTDAARRKVARSLISGIVVAPPVSRSKFAPIEDRFEVRWTGAGNVAGAGR